MLKTVSLFSGAGGMDYGFEQAGFTIVFASELNADSAQTWRLNRSKNSDVMHEGDLAKQLSLLQELGDVDVVIGGPPCQGFSVAGKMDAEDPRSKLVFTYLRAVELIEPKAFLMENVAALATSARWESVRDRISEYANAIGYEISSCVYDAADFGVPEHRKRMLLVGVRKGLGGPEAFHSQMQSRKERPQGLRAVLRGVGVYGSSENPATCTAKITVAKNPVLRGHAYSGMLVNGAGRPMDLSRPSPTLTASMGGNNTPIIDDENLANGKKAHWFEELYEALATTGSFTGEIPSTVRRLSVNEAAAIQTFPRGYRFSGTACSQYRQIGNAVPCRLANLAASSLKAALFSADSRETAFQQASEVNDQMIQTRDVVWA